MKILAQFLAALLLSGPVLAQAPRIDFVNMGGNDCPPCIAWRQTELPKLQAMPEFRLMHYSYVVKTIKSTVPPAFFFPSDAKHLQPALAEASNNLSGSPHQALLVDGKVVDYWFGSRSGKGNADQVAAMVRALHEGKPLPRSTCLKLKTLSSCATPGPS